MKKGVCLSVLFALTLTVTALAQGPRDKNSPAQRAAVEAKQQYVTASPDATTTCSFTFTSGTGAKFLKYCVTRNGNITQFESPSGVEYISLAPAGEGYGFCDFDSRVQYFDYAGYGDSGNWQAPVTLSSSATSVKIARTSNDGIYTLTQTITQNKGQALAQVTMALKNNSGTSHHVGLLRFADVDAQGFAQNSFDFTNQTAFGYNEQQNGLQLQFVSGTFLNGGFSQIIPGPPDACQIFTHVAGPLAATDGSIFMQYDMQLAKNTSKSVVVNYKAF